MIWKQEVIVLNLIIYEFKDKINIFLYYSWINNQCNEMKWFKFNKKSNDTL